MTDRVSGAYVAFKKNMRVDDAEQVLNAIRMIQHIASVSAEEFVSDPTNWMTRQQICSDAFDVSVFTLRYMITQDVRYCFNKAETIASLERMLAALRKE